PPNVFDAQARAARSVALRAARRLLRLVGQNASSTHGFHSMTISLTRVRQPSLNSVGTRRTLGVTHSTSPSIQHSPGAIWIHVERSLVDRARYRYLSTSAIQL